MKRALDDSSSPPAFLHSQRRDPNLTDHQPTQTPSNFSRRPLRRLQVHPTAPSPDSRHSSSTSSNRPTLPPISSIIQGIQPRYGSSYDWDFPYPQVDRHPRSESHGPAYCKLYPPYSYMAKNPSPESVNAYECPRMPHSGVNLPSGRAIPNSLYGYQTALEP